ncbi:unnamed protein product [marine sediment metagenome]|uniref:Uncharacterized protein n=1 Tax=marine sediment metagenome TaxID=412755 RepID=X1QM54_9ZZZZ
MNKNEYKKRVWELLKNYRDDEITSLEELLEKIMALPFPKEGNPYEGMSTREDVDFGKGKKTANRQKKERKERQNNIYVCFLYL